VGNGWATRHPYGIAKGRFNGDRDDDLATTDLTPKAVSVLIAR